jgi:hypothetical protein
MIPRDPIRQSLDALRALPFVQELHFSEQADPKDEGLDGVLTLRTPKKTHSFFVQQKRSYLDTSLLHALIAQAKAHTAKHQKPIFLFARYIPTPSAERLMESGINFIDQIGNLHVNLGRDYERTIIGKKQRTPKERTRPLTSATVWLLFTLAAYQDAPNWSVRQLAEAAGLSKSNIATLRQQLLDRGVLRRHEKRIALADPKKLEDELLQGYELALRPKLFIGRFRTPDHDPDMVLAKTREALVELSVRWSLTGGPAADALQHFYRGLELPIFLEMLSDSLRRRMRLIPDKAGPLIFLRPFGQLPFWKEVQGFPLAHPWLIYAELMNSPEARAHEAAQEIRGQYLLSTHA